MTIQEAQVMAVDIEKLASQLEPMLRRIIQEELLQLAAKNTNLFYLEPDPPLYEDMEEISRRKKEDQ
ncbi:MAG TPA: hypothetical protein G4N96_08425 [Chloroflexi bacterium]|nr:hypothetical protein [Chloroflexota bacterium]